ncbi:uncharacterized protein LOC106170046 [Lingula anatina]|uniref:Uncharacterized protein LOC106170046 n=1 Tax=Lingula anatina TaxID=7574 RepID=A0A1S3J4N3_LINAN|nr:uncharacterized protein LOC106170046 [Lingula anatina]|eukprot:XP_013405226.1 uncharacterized protein LOC106170046 [Lingula anatina]
MAERNEIARSATIAFTLPLSCFICLGKVKEPTVCPNNHAFCSTCMEVWLERNNQCPSCRVPITSANPCRKVIGGLNQGEKPEESFSNPELRKARLDMLFRDYEAEIEHLQTQVKDYKTENITLRDKLTHSDGTCLRCGGLEKGDVVTTVMDKKVDKLMLLTGKLQEATGLYEKVNQDMKKQKKANEKLRDENFKLVRENQNLRQCLVTRSPHKYGRYTVAALESKVEAYEKEIKQLQKALNRSDVYTESLEKEIELLKKGGANISENQLNIPKSSLNSNLSDLEDNCVAVDYATLPVRASAVPIKDNTVGAHYFDRERKVGLADQTRPSSVSNNKGESSSLSYLWKSSESEEENAEHSPSSSFQFEAPSPLTPSSPLSRLCIDKAATPTGTHSSQESGRRTVIERNFTENQPDGNSAKKKLKFETDKEFYTSKRPQAMPSTSKGADVTPVTVKTNLGHFLPYSKAGGGCKTAYHIEQESKVTVSRPETGTKQESCMVGAKNRLSVGNSDNKETNSINTKNLTSDQVKQFRNTEPFDFRVPTKANVPKSSNLNQPIERRQLENHFDETLDTTAAIQNEVADLDITLTPDLTDCLKLLKKAERNIQNVNPIKVDTSVTNSIPTHREAYYKTSQPVFKSSFSSSQTYTQNLYNERNRPKSETACTKVSDVSDMEATPSSSTDRLEIRDRGDPVYRPGFKMEGSAIRSSRPLSRQRSDIPVGENSSASTEQREMETGTSSEFQCQILEYGKPSTYRELHSHVRKSTGRPMAVKNVDGAEDVDRILFNSRLLQEERKRSLSGIDPLKSSPSKSKKSNA